MSLICLAYAISIVIVLADSVREHRRGRMGVREWFGFLAGFAVLSAMAFAAVVVA